MSWTITEFYKQEQQRTERELVSKEDNVLDITRLLTKKLRERTETKLRVIFGDQNG